MIYLFINEDHVLVNGKALRIPGFLKNHRKQNV